MAKNDLSGLSANAKNPRKISKKKLEMLRESMAYYGDLSGIVRVEGGTLVGGHQRVAAYRNDRDAKIEITARYEPPLANGTVAEGYVTAAGSRFSYRECRWPQEKADRAMLASNKSAGEWDTQNLSGLMDSLRGGEFEDAPTMFDEQEAASLFQEEHPPEAIDTPSGSKPATQCPSCGHEFFAK